MRILILFIALISAALFAARTDGEIQSDIQARLARSKIQADGFQIKVQNGVAIWTGKTGVVQHKGAATRMAKAAGASRVDNRIEVSAAAKAKAAQALRRANRVQARTEQRSQQPRTEAEGFVPPPVRRAVVKK